MMMKKTTIWTTGSGKRYGFDERGVMTYQWTVTTGSGATSSDWKYFNSPEDGARMTKGWFKVVAPLDDNDNTFKDYDNTFAATDADEENERWYYADGDGNLATGEIKKINGKYYAFRPEGDGKTSAMLSGLVLLRTEGDKVVEVLDDGVDGDELSDILDGTTKVPADATLFYFGDASDLRTGAQSFKNDDDETVRYSVLGGDNYYLVNTSGSIQKNKTAAKDGDDWYFYVEDRDVKLYANNKNLDDRDTDEKESWEDWAGIVEE